MKKTGKYMLIGIVVLIILYWVGPRVERQELNKELPFVKTGIEGIEGYIEGREADRKSVV